MNPQQRIKQIEALIEKRQERLNELELQAAEYGIDVRPHIKTEIRSIQQEIVKLKSQRDELLPQPANKPANVSPTDNYPAKSPPRILVLDDLPDWRRMVGGLLTDYGYEVVTVGSVKQARRSITRNPSFDLAVIDVRLDNSVEMDESGIDYACELRDGNGNFPIILLTAFEPKLSTLKKITRPPYQFILLAKSDIGQRNPNDLVIQVAQILSWPSPNAE